MTPSAGGSPQAIVGCTPGLWVPSDRRPLEAGSAAS